MLSNGPNVDPVQVAKALDWIGVRYPDAIKDAKYALEHAARELPGGSQVKAASLPAWSLAQLAIWGARLRQHAASRPR